MRSSSSSPRAALTGAVVFSAAMASADGGGDNHGYNGPWAPQTLFPQV